MLLNHHFNSTILSCNIIQISPEWFLCYQQPQLPHSNMWCTIGKVITFIAACCHKPQKKCPTSNSCKHLLSSSIWCTLGDHLQHIEPHCLWQRPETKHRRYIGQNQQKHIWELLTLCFQNYYGHEETTKNLNHFVLWGHSSCPIHCWSLTTS
jgi:hypothetical protein